MQRTKISNRKKGGSGLQECLVDLSQNKQTGTNKQNTLVTQRREALAQAKLLHFINHKS